MNVMTVGLLCIGVYAIFVAVWFRYDKNRDDYTSGKADRS